MLVGAVGGKGVLRQVVGADAEEIDEGRQAVGHFHRRRRLDHDADRQIGTKRNASRRQFAGRRRH